MQLSRFSRKPLALAILAIHGAAWAETMAPEPAKTLQEVVVTEQASGYKPDVASSPKLTQPLKDTPRSITVITESVIKEQGATTLSDILRNVSGISMAAGEGGIPAGDNLTIRGFSARTDIFIDGVRDIGGYTRDPFNVSTVEVFKGPSSAFSGRGSTGGSVNLVSKQPTRENTASGSSSVGTDSLVRQTIDINRTLSETAALRLNVMGQKNDAPGRDHVENERWGIAPSLQLGQGTATRTTLSLEHLEGDNTPDYGIPFLRTNNAVNGKPGRPVHVDRTTWYGLTNDQLNYEETVTDIATLQVDHDLNADQKVRQVFRFGRTDRDSMATAPRFVTPLNSANLDIRRELKGRDARDEVFTSQTDLTSKFTLAGLQHTLVTGVELSRENADAKTISMNGCPAGNTVCSSSQQPTTALIPASGINNPNPRDPFVGTLAAPVVTAAKAETKAVYAFDTIAINPQWDITAGARFDRYSAEFEGKSANTRFEKTDHMYSWNAGVVYKPVKQGSIYLAYGTSFNPSAESLSLAANNAALDPEESRTLELGTKWDLLKSRLALTAALFRSEKTNARTPDALNASAANVLDGEQRVDGAEIGLVGQITPAWQVTASYTYLRGKVLNSNTKVGGVEVETGNELANVPEQSGNIWTTYQVSSRWQVGGGAQYVSERYNNSNSTTRSLVPGHLLFDALLGYQLTPRMNLRLNGYNLTNERYYSAVGGGHVVPGATRSATLTASYDF